MDKNQIIYQAPTNTDAIISIEQYQKKRIRRRKHVARRWAKRFPLFAVEFTQEEFKDYTAEQLKEDLNYKRSKPQKRKAKSQLARQGRYPLMKEAMDKYRRTGEIAFLHKAQQLRKRLYYPFEVVFFVEGNHYVCILPPDAPLHFVKSMLALKINTLQELEKEIKRILQNARFVSELQKIEESNIIKSAPKHPK